MSVERSLFAHNSRLTAHGSQLLQRQRNFLPIWSCSVWGLPCPLHYWSGRALLPHLFTLTLALPPGRYFFCGTFRQSALTPISRALSGTLLCGVRTFLPHRSTRQGRPSGPAAYIHIIFDDLCLYSMISVAARMRHPILATGKHGRVMLPKRLWRHGRLARAISCYKFGAT